MLPRPVLSTVPLSVPLLQRGESVALEEEYHFAFESVDDLLTLKDISVAYCSSMISTMLFKLWKMGRFWIKNLHPWKPISSDWFRYLFLVTALFVFLLIWMPLPFSFQTTCLLTALYQAACRKDQVSRAYDLSTMLTLRKSLLIAIKVAHQERQPFLGEKMAELLVCHKIHLFLSYIHVFFRTILLKHPLWSKIHFPIRNHHRIRH